MKNIPNKIYLQIGEDVSINDKIDFDDSIGVCWSDTRIDKTDIEFVREPESIEKLKNTVDIYTNGIKSLRNEYLKRKDNIYRYLVNGNLSQTELKFGKLIAEHINGIFDVFIEELEQILEKHKAEKQFNN